MFLLYGAWRLSLSKIEIYIRICVSTKYSFLSTDIYSFLKWTQSVTGTVIGPTIFVHDS